MNSFATFILFTLLGLPFQKESNQFNPSPSSVQSFVSYSTSSHLEETLQDTTFSENPIQLQTAKGAISGTLLAPASFTKGPVVLIIAGSGPTDSDGNNPVMKNNSLKLLATNLARKGIASVRYDKRGIGESKPAGLKEEDLRFEDYISDASGWIELLKKDPRFSSVSIIGHSEGSLIGMIAAANADKYISLAGAGQSAEKILKDQLGKQPPVVKDLAFPILDSLKNGKRVTNVDPMLFALFRPSVQPYMISWFRYDPQVEIAKLKIPVMIVQGTTDIQVTTEDAQRLSRAHPTAKLVIIKNMNHILKTVIGDRNENIATYNDPSLPVSTELTDAVAEFLLKDK